MASKKQGEKKKTTFSGLSYEDYCATLKLALKIRKEHATEINNAVTPQQKAELQRKLFEDYHILNSTSEAREREEAIILKVNIFLPDTSQFVIDYQTRFDKNIRLISEHYQVPAPFVISKISEVGRYGKYLEQIQKEGGLKKDIDELSFDEEKRKQTITSTIKEVKEPIKKEVSSTTSTTYSSIESDELMRHIGSMQIYCARLLESNEELASENEDLQQQVKNLEALVKKLEMENAKLNCANMVSESPIENSLRKQVKDLECTNKELVDALNTQSIKTKDYRNRAVIAEAQLDQIQAGMKGIAQEVDSIDLSPFSDFESDHKRMIS